VSSRSQGNAYSRRASAAAGTFDCEFAAVGRSTVGAVTYDDVVFLVCFLSLTDRTAVDVRVTSVQDLDVLQTVFVARLVYENELSVVGERIRVLAVGVGVTADELVAAA